LNSEPPLVTKIRESVNYCILFFLMIVYKTCCSIGLMDGYGVQELKVCVNKHYLVDAFVVTLDYDVVSDL
jgi:hypothetical protein